MLSTQQLQFCFQLLHRRASVTLVFHDNTRHPALFGCTEADFLPVCDDIVSCCCWLVALRMPLVLERVFIGAQTNETLKRTGLKISSGESVRVGGGGKEGRGEG